MISIREQVPTVSKAIRLMVAGLREIPNEDFQISMLTYGSNEESEFVSYGDSWFEYNEPSIESLKDLWPEATRRFNKLIAHYEFLEGKAPKPEQYIIPVTIE